MERQQSWLYPFIIGTLLALFVPAIPAFFYLLLLLALGCWLLVRKKNVMAVVLLALCWFGLHGLWATRWTLDPAMVKQPIRISGVVDTIPNRSVDDLGFTMRLTAINLQPLAWYVRPLIKLNWQQPDHSLQLGDSIELTVKLKPAHGFANLAGFSYQKYLLLDGVRATGYVVASQPLQLRRASTSYRQSIYQKLKLATDTLPHQGLILALTMGEKQLISAAQWQTIKVSGISHLLAISGLHIGIVFLFTLLVAKWLLKIAVYPTHQELNVVFLALFAGLAGALGYAWLAGFAIPTVRAVLMLSILVLTLSLNRRVSARTVIILTLFIILLINPLSILEPGLWLSFVAVMAILAAFWWFVDLPSGQVSEGLSLKRGVDALGRYLKSIVKLQLALFVLLLPLTIVIFNGFSGSGGWVNLLAVPWVSFVTVPAALLGAVLTIADLPSSGLFNIADQSLALMFDVLQRPWIDNSWLSVQYVPWYSWLLLVISGLSWLMIQGKILRYCSGLLLLPALLTWSNVGVEANRWQVHVLDVGQGLALVVEKDRQAMVYDLGPIYRSGFNTVDHVVLPFLAYRGYATVDPLVISHADTDHSGAYQTFLRHIDAATTIAPPKLLPAANRCLSGPATLWQGLRWQVLWPIDGQLPPTTSNDSSCVIKISNETFSVLLTGDISKRVEKQLIRHYGAELAATILIAPHHGSNSSSTEAFIAAVDPQYVVYSVGFLNRYAFPRAAVVQRYQAKVVAQLNTAELGQLSFDLSGPAVKLTGVRRDQLSQWYYNQ